MIIGILIVGTGVIATPNGAAAKNLDLLIRYLVPVFLAQNFYGVCHANDPWFLAELPTGVRTVGEFSAYIKDEITDGLPAKEAAQIVLIAANTALEIARVQMRKISPAYPKMPADTLKGWCQKKGRPFILGVITEDVKEHKAFLKIIKAAKQ